MRKYFFGAILWIFVSFHCSAQDRILTLKECIRIGLENNLVLKKTAQDVQKATLGVSESRARLLPVINGFGNFTNNVDRSTSVTDGSGMSALLGIDMPYMETRGLRYVTSGGIKLSMPLYHQTLYTSISIAEKISSLNNYTYEKAKEDLIVEISKIYYLAQTSAEQISLIRENIGRLEELRYITRAYHDNGLVLDIDVKRVNINLENLRVQLHNSQAVYEQQINLLRYVLDLPPEELFMLEPVDTSIQEDQLLIGLSPHLYELRMLELQTDIISENKKSIRSEYLPSLSLVSQLSYTNYTDKFRNYFHDHPSNHWYNGFYWGLSLNVPVFDGLSKRINIRQTEADLLQSQYNQENVQKNLQVQYLNSVNDWSNNRRNFQKQQDNHALAEGVYEVTLLKYKEGVASMSELLQDEMVLSEAQSNYISALLNCKLSELTIRKLTKQLDTLSE